MTKVCHNNVVSNNYEISNNQLMSCYLESCSYHIQSEIYISKLCSSGENFVLSEFESVQLPNILLVKKIILILPKILFVSYRNGLFNSR